MPYFFVQQKYDLQQVCTTERCLSFNVLHCFSYLYFHDGKCCFHPYTITSIKLIKILVTISMIYSPINIASLLCFLNKFLSSKWGKLCLYINSLSHERFIIQIRQKFFWKLADFDILINLFSFHHWKVVIIMCLLYKRIMLGTPYYK